MACFEPTLDYCVVKIPKWPFDKFETGKRKLGTMMMATGEVMAIGNNFESALLKGIRSLEIKQYGLDYQPSKKFTLHELKRPSSIWRRPTFIPCSRTHSSRCYNSGDL